jgi:cytochrome c biogenesis protein
MAAPKSRTTPIGCVIWPKQRFDRSSRIGLIDWIFSNFADFSALAGNVPLALGEEEDMTASVHSVFPKTVRKTWQTLGAIRTGVILLILVVIISAAGTVILQRPATDADEMQRAYSPQVLRLLDGVGLTDVFHAWWFVTLLVLVSLSIVAASLQRFPNSWRYYARPYKSPDEAFRKALTTQALIPIKDEEVALSVAERVLQRTGFGPERIIRESGFSLFGERNRFSEMSVYIVHASLLLIFLGGIVDALYGWRAFVMLTRGQQSSQVQTQNGDKRNLTFAIRCDGAGQENYVDGTPKRWWSDLAIVENGQVVVRKQIVVNDPLVYHSVRFYQASYGKTGKIDKLVLTATPRDGKPPQEITIGLGQSLPLDSGVTVHLAEFIPDYVVRDGQIYARSGELENPAAHLLVESRKSGQAVNVWLPPIPGFEQNDSSPYTFEGKDVQMAYFTGLEVSHEPGQWSVWAGVLVMGLGLAVVFYFVHVRLWAVPVRDARGHLMLWIGGTANKNKDVFEERFRKLVEQIESELKISSKSGAEAPVTALAGR